MGRKIKKVIMIAAFGMVTGGQIADLLPEGNVMQVEAGSRKQIIKVKNKGKDGKKEFDKDKDNAKDNEKDLVEEGEKEDRKDSEEDREKDDKKDDGKDPEKDDEKDDGKDSEKDDEKEDGKDPEKDDEKEDGKDSEKDDEKDDGKDLEKDDEKENGKDPEEEEIKMYHAEYEDPDGQNGYYISAPTGKITHLSKNGVTRYLFENGNGERQEGTLEKLNESCRLKQLNFADGRNELEVWMEDEEHHQIENSESRKEFWIDSVRPVIGLEVSGGADIWHKEAAEVVVEASDGSNGSQIAEIVCKTGEKIVGKSSKGAEKFVITESSQNGESTPVTIIATDYAGNQTVVTDRVFVDRDAPKALIQGVEDYTITSKPVQVSYLAEEENVIQTVRANILKEDIDGKKEETEITEWKTKSRNESGDTKKESVQTLAEDGLYKLRMNVTDMAGNVSHAERQLIIDKENPVIAHVDELDGKYLKKFSWNYSIEESIKDFTNYTYVMKVDDAFYRPGEKIEKEGVHVLTIEAFDSAGNKGEAKARFTIDHTPPVIEFEGIEDGEKYEKEKTFYVRTENLEDQIEYIKINGKKQNRKKQKKGYEIQLNEAKNYEIEVKAKDFAGNEKVSQIGFEIYEEKSLWQKIVEPVRKYIFYGNEKVIQDEKMVKEDKKEGKKKNIILWERAVLFGALIVVGIWKREKVKEIWKNLS